MNLNEVKNGIVCFTFDDSHSREWVEAIPVFQKYNATASFFFSGEIDEEKITAAKKLFEAGHTVGLHAKNHADAPEYFEAKGAEAYYTDEIKNELETFEKAGLKISSFAYPNNRRTDETDKFLGQYFNRFRAGWTNAKEEEVYLPIEKLSETRVMRGFGIGEYYSTDINDLLEKIRRAARENVCITFYSHNIYENAEHIHMPLDMLEKCLAEAKKNNVLVLGFDEL